MLSFSVANESPPVSGLRKDCPDPRPGEWSVWGADARKREVVAALDDLRSDFRQLSQEEIRARVDLLLALIEDPRQGLTNEPARDDWRLELQSIAGR